MKVITICGSLKYQNILALALEAVPELQSSEIEKNISQLNDYKEKIADAKILMDVVGSDHCPVKLIIDL